MKFSLRLNPQTDIIKTKESRELYNFFLQSFENKYNLINSFSDSIKEISIDLQNVLKTQIILNKPIKSMLGTRINTINEAFETCEKPCFSDFKYDGLRIQIHNNFGKVTFFSRNLDDITKQFPELVKIIQDNFSDISFVLDTECVGFDFEKKEFLPFQILSRRIMSKKFDDVSQIKVVLKAFDIIYLNGETLLNTKFEERRDLLESLFIRRKLIFLKNINLLV
ncbi:hypothetical protein EOM09_07595 [bacterium]|nr:hypothetical protein [bacterium]